jgi:hypothetical protein
MIILWLFNTTGWIFGPAILLAGLVALLLSLRASFWARTPPARRAALVASLGPLALGVCAALVGLAVWGYVHQPGANQGVPWWALGKACLAGAVTTVIPLVWSVLLVRAQGHGT